MNAAQLAFYLALGLAGVLPLVALRWLVVVVIAYAAFAMLRSAAREGTSVPDISGVEIS